MQTFLANSLHFLSQPRWSSQPTANNFTARAKMSSLSSSAAALVPPENGIVLGCGGVGLDLLAAVDKFPKPDDKTRTSSFQVQGGGNAGNALTCAARLGLSPRIISKVADDAQGRGILKELEDDGVDTSFLVVSPGNSPFTYVIVDSETKTRTCIHTPGNPPMVPQDLSKSKLDSALTGARLVYSDVRLHETALVIAEEAARRNIPILVDSERKREGLDEMLNLSSYVVCPAEFPQTWTEASSLPKALLSMLVRLPKLKFVIATLAEDGCIMIEKILNDEAVSEETDIDEVFKSLKQKIADDLNPPSCVSSRVTNLRADGIGMVCGKLHVGTAEKIPAADIVDTTGAGDAFIGAVLYAICTDMPPEKMLPFASVVAGCGIRALGARTGLPHSSDPRLAPYLSESAKVAVTML